MKCPYCLHEESKVTDSRNAGEGEMIRRRRECLGCARRFTTFETVDLSVQVRKRDGRYQDFRLAKLVRGIDAAALHTQMSHDQVRRLASAIVQELIDRQLQEVTTQEIGAIVMEHLRGLDTIAYIRFACVYRRFKDIDEFMEVIQPATTGWRADAEGISRREGDAINRCRDRGV